MYKTKTEYLAQSLTRDKHARASTSAPGMLQYSVQYTVGNL